MTSFRYYYLGGLWFLLIICVVLLLVDSTIFAAAAEEDDVCTSTTTSSSSSILSSSSSSNSAQVYIYQEEVFHHRTELERCDPGGLDGMTTDSKHAVGDVLLEYLTNNNKNTNKNRNQTPHLVVTDNPKEADWFYVPFNIDRSHGQHVMSCGQNHLRRLNKVLEALSNSKYYQRYQGADHMWYIGGWQFSVAGIGKLPPHFPPYFPFHREIIHNMAILRYPDQRVHVPGTQPTDDNEDYRQQPQQNPDPANPFDILSDTRVLRPWWRQGQDHRCTVNVPHRSNPEIQHYHPHIAEQQQTLEEWEQARPYKFHFVGAGKQYPYSTGQKSSVQHLIAKWETLMEQQQLPSQLVFHRSEPIPSKDFAESLTQSQFCLMIRGDDPSRSRFSDALSAGCIPIIISDGFDSYATGYGRMIHNYATFSIHIPESQWLVHPTSMLLWVTTMPRQELRFMHTSLMQVRPKLVFEVEDYTGECRRDRDRDHRGEGDNKGGKEDEGNSNTTNNNDNNCGSQVIEYIFQALNERCKLDKEELHQYLS